jgi:hypothetical protein
MRARLAAIMDPAPVPQTVPVTVIAQDPDIKRGSRILTEEIRITAEHLEPGPRGARFHVVDYDSATKTLLDPVVMRLEAGQDVYAGATDTVLRTDPGFRAQNVYAIAARTLAGFEAALGRRLCWGFNGHQLYLVPHAFPEANAYYSPEDGAIYFGYVPQANGEILTALSHDVVAHETTHAILDGLRPRLVEPGLPDQPAFHEALADIVALLSIFSLPAVVRTLLGDPDAAGRLSTTQIGERALRRTALFSVADQLGSVLSSHGGALRRSVDMKPSAAWRADPAFVEPHRRAEVLVAAVMRTLLRMWRERLPAITSRGGADRDRVAEEGATAAGHLLRMMTRGVDYLPPVELEFEDVVDAVLTADEVVAPDDEHGYREALEQEFGAFGIARPVDRIADLSSGPQPVYDRMNYAILRSDRDELMRFIWDNADVFGIDRAWRTRVDSVRPAVRIGPDGLVVPEVVATYVQELELTGADLAATGVTLPPGIEDATELQVLGGGVLVFDQFGRAKLHQRKPLADWERQERRLAYLAERGLADTRGQFGFTLSMPRGQRFAALHVAGDRAGEDW